MSANVKASSGLSRNSTYCFNFQQYFIVDMNNLSYQLVMQVMHKLYVLQ